MPDLRKALNSGRILLMDGAMGTELQRTAVTTCNLTRPFLEDCPRLGADLQVELAHCCEFYNRWAPEAVLAIHQAYVEAGAACLLTNTFQCKPERVSTSNQNEYLELFCRPAIDLARQAAGADRFVIASIGPIDLTSGTRPLDAAIRALSTADALLLETWSDGFERALQRATDPAINQNQLPVLLSLTYRSPGPNLYPSGMWPSEAARLAVAYPIAALGVNCGCDIDLEQILIVLRGYREITDLPLLVRPNAGSPRHLNGQWIYPRTPEEMAGWVPAMLNNGVRLLGGCCGTAPAHIVAFQKVLGSSNPRS
jgi:5-methyltetrahydrofolate--homocysteine methyltransferase